MSTEPEFSESSPEVEPEEAAPEPEDDGQDVDMLLVESAEDLRAVVDEAEQEAAEEEAGPSLDDDDGELAFSDTSDLSEVSELPKEAPPPPRRPPSGRRPPPAPGSRTGRRPRPSGSGRLQPGSETGRRRRPSGSGSGSGSGRIPGTASGRHRRSQLEQTASGRHRRLSPSEEMMQMTASGRHRRLESGSGRHRTTSSRSRSQSSSDSRRISRGQPRQSRTPEEEADALKLLEERVQPPPPGDPYLGRDLGPFKVERFLEVDRGERRYIATYDETQKFVLLRVFPFGGSYKAEFRRLAERGERSCRIQHEHLEGAVASGRTKECFYVGSLPPMGPTLAEVMASRELDQDDVQVLLEQLAAGLRALGSRDAVHGHISPLTIREERPGSWILVEAGLCRPRPSFSFLAAGGDVIGYPGFIAPETVDSGNQTPAADLYSLGCVAWTVLVGRPPFQGDDEVQLLLDQLNREVGQVLNEKPDVSPNLSNIVGKLTGYTTDVRYGQTTDLINDLKALRDGQTVAAPVADLKLSEEEKLAALGRGSSLLTLALLFANVIVLCLLVALVYEVRRTKLPDPFYDFELPLPALQGQ